MSDDLRAQRLASLLTSYSDDELLEVLGKLEL
jgi:hypothetical protein